VPKLIDHDGRREEIAEARAAGMECLSLGKRILRTETAALCALSLLMLFLED